MSFLIWEQGTLENFVAVKFDGGERCNFEDRHAISFEKTNEAFFLPHVFEGANCAQATVFFDSSLLEDS